MEKRTIKILWHGYYSLLWGFRCYVWNPCYGNIGRLADWLFDQADLQVRKRLK